MGKRMKYIILPWAREKALALTKVQSCLHDRAPDARLQAKSLFHTISSLDKIGAVSLY